MHSLKYNYSLSEFLDLKETVEILDSMELAAYKDEELKTPKAGK